MTRNYNTGNKIRVSAFIYRIMLTLLVIPVSSCSFFEDVMDKAPLDKYSDAAVWQDETLIKSFVNNTYRSIPTGGFGGLPAYLSAFADEMKVIGVGFDSQVNAGELTPSNVTTAPLNYWNAYYSAIGKCNIFLDRIQASTIDEVVKSRLTAEIKIIRAYCYFGLASFYGDAPVIERPLILTDNLDLPRDSYEEVMDFVVAELDAGAALLPTDYPATDKGRITKGAALAIKSRALLYAASPLNNPGNDLAKWQAAADAAKAVIDLGVYSLHSNYKQLFLDAAAYNAEIIWQRPYNNLVDFELAVEVALYPAGSNGRAQISPIHNVVADYETLNGLQPEDDPAYDPQKPFLNRDPRFYATILYDGAPFKGRTIDTFVPGGIDGNEYVVGSVTVARPGYYLRKFMDETITDPLDTRIGNTPWTFFRYAEILLDYAEAKHFLGDDVAARQYINMVRKRPGVVMPDVTESGPALFERIVNERRIELAFEGHRFFDVRRWQIAPTVLNINAQEMHIARDPVTLVKTYTVRDFLPERKFFDRNYLLPIPQSEIERSPSFSQNPGY
ncbi:MAG: RagB/SusD family nutrient uptake outer membrane protein [Cyclobacteriaceae bacterium]